MVKRLKVFYEGLYYSQPFSKASWVAEVRYWLIHLLARDDVIIINANLCSGEREQKEFPVRVDSVEGVFMKDIRFDLPDNLQIKITQKEREKNGQ